MKKLFLSIFALLVGFNCAQAQYLLSMPEENTYAITLSYEEALEIEGVVDQEDGKWYGYFSAGTLLYQNEYVKIEVATDGTYAANNGYNSTQVKDENPGYTGWVNCGSTLARDLTDDLRIEDIAAAGKDWQGMLMVTPNYDGYLEFGVYAGDNTRSIGIYEVATEEEYDNETERAWVAINQFRHSDDELTTDPDLPAKAPAYVSGDVTAGRQYLLVGGGANNMNMHKIIFVPSSAPQSTGASIEFFTKPEENTYAITGSYEEMIQKEGVVDQEDGKWYGYFSAGTVLYEDGEVRIEVATDGTYAANNGYNSTQVKDENPGYTGWVNCGSTLARDLTDDLRIEDIAAAGKDWQGMLMVTPNYDGYLEFGVYAGDNTRSIGIYEVATEEEYDNETERAWVAINQFRHSDDELTTDPDLPAKAPAYVGGSVTAGRQYLLVGGGANNMNMHKIVYVPETTGIKGITTIATPIDGKIYSIDGRYVGTEIGNLSKGVYIMNGKKFIVK